MISLPRTSHRILWDLSNRWKIYKTILATPSSFESSSKYLRRVMVSKLIRERCKINGTMKPWRQNYLRRRIRPFLALFKNDQAQLAEILKGTPTPSVFEKTNFLKKCFRFICLMDETPIGPILGLPLNICYEWSAYKIVFQFFLSHQWIQHEKFSIISSKNIF